MYDNFLFFKKLIDKNLKDKNFILATLHRAKNTDDIYNLKKIHSYFKKNFKIFFLLYFHFIQELKKLF